MNSFINDIKYDNKLCSIFKEEYENYFFSFKKGQGAGLIAFLNATEFIEKQKELIKQEDYIIDILFSSKIVMVDNNPYNNSLKLLLKELLDIENATISDIKYIDSGCFSDVYRIKDLILKVGELRKNIEIPSHNLILKPFFRRYLSDIGITVEVSRYVDKVTDENIVREIFMKLYDDNIVWLDPKIENIGKIVSLKNTDMKALPQYISNESIGFIGDNMQSLKVGSYVILDTDYLIYKDKLKEENITPQVKYYLNDCAIKRKK
jgi:hypothetical protein